MLSNQIVVRFTFILVTCSSLGLAQRSEPASTSAVGGQIVISGKSSLKEPMLVLLDHSGSRHEQRTSTDFRGAADVLSQAIRIEPGSAIAHYALERARYKLSQ